MPTYDYHCETCGQNFEHFQSMSSPKLTTCPENVCTAQSAKGKGSVVRKISGGAGLLFNGAGFYSTDYVPKSGAPSKSEATTSETTKSEGKSAEASSTSADSSSASPDSSSTAPKDAASKDSVSKSTTKSSSDSTSGTSAAS